MARKKKTIKQTGLQNVVQTVKVVVGGAKAKRRRKRAPRSEPQVETISAKTLAPVFIQPPVSSQPQQYPYDMHQVGMPYKQPTATHLYSGIKPMAEIKEIISSKEPAEEFKTGDILPENIVIPVSNTVTENPTTTVDSTHTIDETTGFVSDNNPTGDISLTTPLPKAFDVSVSSQNVPNNFDELTFLQPETITHKKPKTKKHKTEKSKRIYSVVREPAIDNFLLHAFDKNLRNLSREEAKTFIKETAAKEQLTWEEFRNKYIDYGQRRKEQREITKYKAKEYDVQYQPKDTVPSTNITNISPLYETISSTTK